MGMTSVTNDELQNGLKDLAHKLEMHELACANNNEVVRGKLEALHDCQSKLTGTLDNLNKTAWQAVATIALPIVGMFMWFYLQVWPVQQQSEQERHALIQNQYTAEDAAKDRAALNRQLAEIRRSMK